MDPLIRSIHHPYESQYHKTNHVQEKENSSSRKVDQDRSNEGYIVNARTEKKREEPIVQINSTVDVRKENVPSSRLIRSNDISMVNRIDKSS